MDKHSLEQLNNTGIIRVNDSGIARHATIVVLGLPRSGTSFVASTLNHLGLFLGDLAFAPTYEDKSLKDAFDQKNEADFSAIVGRYNSAHNVWAMKAPRISYRPADALRHLRSPRIIVTFRDPVSVQIRRELSQGSTNTLEGIRETIEGYNTLCQRLATLDVPMLFLSYDKVAPDPQAAIGEIAAFCGVGDPARIETALTKVKHDSTKYRDEERVDKSYGAVEDFSPIFISGWAIHRDVDDKPAPNVEVLLDGGPVPYRVTVKAREDLRRRAKKYFDELGIRKQFVHRNLRRFDDRIGFEIRFDEAVSGEIQLRVRGDRFPFFKRVVE